MPTDGVNKNRRRFLVATTSVVGAVGVGFTAVPYIKSWKPSAKAQAVGAPVQVSLDTIDLQPLIEDLKQAKDGVHAQMAAPLPAAGTIE